MEKEKRATEKSRADAQLPRCDESGRRLFGKKRGGREGLSAIDLVALQAACADVTRLDLAVLDIGDLLHIGFEGALGLAVGVADIVAGRLTFSADTANSRHKKPPEGRKFLKYPLKRTGDSPARTNQ